MKQTHSRAWDFDTLRTITVDRATGKVSYDDMRRGCESGAEQSLNDFVEKGPEFGAELSRALTIEILEFVGLESTPWFDPVATVEVQVQGTPVIFYQYPTLKVHGESLKSIVSQVGLSPEEYYRQFPIAEGVLARQVRLQGFDFKAQSELCLHPSGNIWMGTLAVHAELGGRIRPAGTRFGLTETGLLEFASDD